MQLNVSTVLVAQTLFVFFCLVRSESLWRQISDHSEPGSASEGASSLSIAGARVLGGCWGVVTCI